MDKEPSPEAIDNPQDLYGLMKSNSVSARACMWQQLQMQANKSMWGSLILTFINLMQWFFVVF